MPSHVLALLFYYAKTVVLWLILCEQNRANATAYADFCPCVRRVLKPEHVEAGRQVQEEKVTWQKQRLASEVLLFSLALASTNCIRSKIAEASELASPAALVALEMIFWLGIAVLLLTEASPVGTRANSVSDGAPSVTAEFMALPEECHLTTLIEAACAEADFDASAVLIKRDASADAFLDSSGYIVLHSGILDGATQLNVVKSITDRDTAIGNSPDQVMAVFYHELYHAKRKWRMMWLYYCAIWLMPLVTFGLSWKSLCSLVRSHLAVTNDTNVVRDVIIAAVVGYVFFKECFCAFRHAAFQVEETGADAYADQHGLGPALAEYLAKTRTFPKQNRLYNLLTSRYPSHEKRIMALLQVHFKECLVDKRERKGRDRLLKRFHPSAHI